MDLWDLLRSVPARWSGALFEASAWFPVNVSSPGGARNHWMSTCLSAFASAGAIPWPNGGEDPRVPEWQMLARLVDACDVYSMRDPQ